MIPASLFRAAFLICLAVITWLSLAPLEALPPIKLWDKASHLIAFAALAFLMRCGWQTWSFFLIFSLLIVYGLSMETCQHFLPFRHFSLADLLADTIGVLAGLVIAHWLRPLWFQASPNRIREG